MHFLHCILAATTKLRQETKLWNKKVATQLIIESYT